MQGKYSFQQSHFSQHYFWNSHSVSHTNLRAGNNPAPHGWYAWIYFHILSTVPDRTLKPWQCFSSEGTPDTQQVFFSCTCYFHLFHFIHKPFQTAGKKQTLAIIKCCCLIVFQWCCRKLLTAQNSDDSIPLQQNVKKKNNNKLKISQDGLENTDHFLSVGVSVYRFIWQFEMLGEKIKHWWHSCTAVSIFKDANIEKCCAALFFL